MPSYTESKVTETLSKRTPQERVQRSQEQERVLAICLAVRAELDAQEPSYDATAGSYINPELVMGAGVVTPPSDARVNRAYAGARAGRSDWASVSIRDNYAPAETLRQIGSYGWAVSPFGDADTAKLREAAQKGYGTVNVSAADGTQTIEPAAKYRKLRQERRAAAKDAAVSVAQRQAATDAAAHAAIGADRAVADGIA